MTTKQERAWISEIGVKYTDRSTYLLQDLDSLYLRLLGITRTDLNANFLRGLPPSLQILEVGCNIGLQLRHLQAAGYWDLHGVELQQDALNRFCTDGVETCQGSALNLPYQDESFDLVFTSGLLIHISPSNLPLAMSEIRRCSRRYIWGFEYFSQTTQEITWRKWKDMMWSADYARLFISQFPDLVLIDWWSTPYLGRDQRGLVASMYMLEKV